MIPNSYRPFEEICVYVAGAYNAPTAVEMFNNMRKGMRTAMKLMGLTEVELNPFCPWLDFHYALVGDGEENAITLERFYRYSIAWLRRSDYVLLVPGWENSKGTKRELEVAREENIPVFESIEALLEQVKKDNEIIKFIEVYNAPFMARAKKELC